MESEKVSVVSPFIEKLFGYIAAGLLLLAGEYARAAAVAESPFAEIVNTVKIQCRSNPEFDDIDW